MQNKWNQIKTYLTSIQCQKTQIRSNIFKIPLETLWNKHHGQPIFFQIAIDYLRRNALNETRMFRDKPDTEEYKEFIHLCEQGNINELQHQNNQYQPSPLIVAWFIRMFLFRLPISLIPNHYQLHQRLLNAIDTKIPNIFIQGKCQGCNNEQMNEIAHNHNDNDGILDELLYIKSLIMSLQREHFHTLRSVLSLFHEICRNQMNVGFEALDAHHLAQIFGPIFFGCTEIKKMNSDNARKMDLSQDLTLFLINHYYDIFERNTFKEMVYIHRINKDVKKIQLEQSAAIQSLEKTRADLAEKLCKCHFDSKLRSRSFLAWKACVPRYQSLHKHHAKLQLEDSVRAKNEVIQKQAKKIITLATKLELNEFDTNLTKSSGSFKNLLNETAGHHDAMAAMKEYLRHSMEQISNVRQYDRTITNDSSYKSLFGTIDQNI